MKFEINLDCIYVNDHGWEESLSRLIKQEIEDSLRKMIRKEIQTHHAKVRKTVEKAVDEIMAEVRAEHIKKVAATLGEKNK